MSTPPKPVLSAIVEAETTRALSRYVDLVSPQMLATLREVLEDALTTHPVAIRLVDHLRERVAPDSSGAVPKEGAGLLRDEKAGGDQGAS